ncbi:MAG: hypothetical protein ACOC80_14670 [Petrotogales bacterium]
MESKIKIYGPPIDKAIAELQKLAEQLPTISKSSLSRSIIPSGETLVGDYDFVFYWAKEPDENQLRQLIFNIDEALRDIGCRYTITTTTDSTYPYKL